MHAKSCFRISSPAGPARVSDVPIFKDHVSWQVDRSRFVHSVYRHVGGKQTLPTRPTYVRIACRDVGNKQQSIQIALKFLPPLRPPANSTASQSPLAWAKPLGPSSGLFTAPQRNAQSSRQSGRRGRAARSPPGSPLRRPSRCEAITSAAN